MAYVDIASDTGYDIGVLRLDDRKAQPFLRTRFFEGGPTFSPDGGIEPVWNQNGRELFYRSGNKMMTVDVIIGTTFSAGRPRMLFEAEYVPSPASLPNYDVSSDGQRFLMLKAGDQAQPATQINVVTNWVEEQKRRVPVK